MLATRSRGVLGLEGHDPLNHDSGREDSEPFSDRVSEAEHPSDAVSLSLASTEGRLRRRGALEGTERGSLRVRRTLESGRGDDVREIGSGSSVFMVGNGGIV